MRCRTCSKTINVSNPNHNKEKRQCAKCHYLGQISAWPGGKYTTGRRWCKTCQEWKTTNELRCSDCNKLLRTIPCRKEFREKIKVMVRY